MTIKKPRLSNEEWEAQKQKTIKNLEAIKDYYLGLKKKLNEEGVERKTLNRNILQANDIKELEDYFIKVNHMQGQVIVNCLNIDCRIERMLEQLR